MTRFLPIGMLFSPLMMIVNESSDPHLDLGRARLAQACESVHN